MRRRRMVVQAWKGGRSRIERDEDGAGGGGERGGCASRRRRRGGGSRESQAVSIAYRDLGTVQRPPCTRPSSSSSASDDAGEDPPTTPRPQQMGVMRSPRSAPARSRYPLVAATRHERCFAVLAVHLSRDPLFEPFLPSLRQDEPNSRISLLVRYARVVWRHRRSSKRMKRD